MTLTISMPLPPSANALTRNIPGVGRAKTQAYKAWLEEAGYHALIAHRSAGSPIIEAPLKLTITLGLRDRKRDAGNCLKAIEDMLVKTIPLLPDDRFNDHITLRRDATTPAGTAVVTVEHFAGDG